MEIFELATVSVTMALSEECRGTFNLTTCAFVSAIGEYDININNDEATLSSTEYPRIVAIANNSQVERQFSPSLYGHRSTLAGLVYVANSLWEGHAWYSLIGNQVSGLAEGVAERYQESSRPSCNSWRDPLQDVISSMNKAMIYAAALAVVQNGTADLERAIDPGTKIDYSITGYQYGMHSVFHTDWWYFGGAAVVELLCIALIAPTYFGWWRLGRVCSFSPLELAKLSASNPPPPYTS